MCAACDRGKGKAHRFPDPLVDLWYSTRSMAHASGMSSHAKQALRSGQVTVAPRQRYEPTAVLEFDDWRAM